jgi:muconolactone D-isomerase
MEFLVRIDFTIPPNMSPDVLAELRMMESVRALELAKLGVIVRLWRTPARWGNWGYWRAQGREDLIQFIDSLPLRPLMSVEIHDLEPHPSDPGIN